MNNVSTLAVPVLTSASNLDLECNTVTDTTAIRLWLESNGGASATVECGSVNWTHDYTGLTPNCGNSGSVLVNFTAVNECGLFSSTAATITCLLYTSPSPRDATLSRMPSSA